MNFEPNGQPAQFLDHLPVIDERAPRIVASAAIWLALLAVIALFPSAALIRANVTIRGDFTLVPAEESVVVKSPISGTVGQVLVHEGAQVEKGQILVELDSAELQRRLDRLLEDRRVSLSQVEAFERSLRHSLLLCHGRWKQQGASYDPAVVNLRLAQLELALAELAGNQKARASAQHGVSHARPDDEEKRVSEYRQRVRELEAAVRSEPLLEDTELARMEALVGSDQAKLAEAQVALERISREVQNLSRQIALAQVVAPHAGTIAHLRYQTGDMPVERGDELLWVIPGAPYLAARVVLPATACHHVRTGSAVRLELDEQPFQEDDILSGSVVRTGSKRTDDGEQCLVLVAVPGASHLAPGSGGQANFVLRRASLFDVFVSSNP